MVNRSSVVEHCKTLPGLEPHQQQQPTIFFTLYVHVVGRLGWERWFEGYVKCLMSSSNLLRLPLNLLLQEKRRGDER